MIARFPLLPLLLLGIVFLASVSVSLQVKPPSHHECLQSCESETDPYKRKACKLSCESETDPLSLAQISLNFCPGFIIFLAPPLIL
ncbi:Beta-conglycinin, alpha' chain [Glycine max]|nr:Beta-conglycinin, alpha' chain [Glycine max]